MLGNIFGDGSDSVLGGIGGGVALGSQLCTEDLLSGILTGCDSFGRKRVGWQLVARIARQREQRPQQKLKPGFRILNLVNACGNVIPQNGFKNFLCFDVVVFQNTAVQKTNPVIKVDGVQFCGRDCRNLFGAPHRDRVPGPQR